MTILFLYVFVMLLKLNTVSLYSINNFISQHLLLPCRYKGKILDGTHGFSVNKISHQHIFLATQKNIAV